ncbi:MAG: indolepyruvate ferredoxin oxidoreductase subunit alpha [Methanolinea sp.]|nr:indolepyruvate ferredoxin oxidoreductase subunit alpha [Methanolinea sp.]
MRREYLLGNEAIARGCLEAPVDFVTGYPGTPSSEVIDILRGIPERGYYVEWSVNEKVALENALAAAWCGLRALVTMKHVGLNVAADPLMTSAYTGVTGGLVIMSADDPFAHSSQNEQDSRCYALFAKIPCLDPSTIQEAHDMARDAFSLSEQFGLPVIFRPTTRICHSKGDTITGEPAKNTRKGEFHKDPKQYVVIPAHTRVLHRKLNEKQPAVKKALVENGYNKAVIRGPRAVVASGIAAAYVEELIPDDVSLVRIGAYPVDEGWLRDQVRRHESVLVVEELHPVVEEIVRQVSGGVPVSGKKDGLVPWEGELSTASVASILKSFGIEPRETYPPAVPVADLPPRPPILCAGCMHRPVFYAIRRVFKDGIFPSDIGCYTLGLQLGAVDTTLCMGAAVTVASGLSHAGEKREIVATIGDSTFLHSGIPGLINAVYNGARMILVILDNRVTAMTGHQPNPCSGTTATGAPSPQISLEAVCRACGVQWVETVDPYDLVSTMATLRAAAEQPGVKVVIARQPCVITARRANIRRGRFEVDREACTACGVCIGFGCPAIERGEEDKARITDLCSGCGVCAQICPAGAIRKERRKEGRR